MTAFPRLAGLFGVPVDRLDATAVRRAVGAQVREDEQLDWKATPYERRQGYEIAKDVAAFANAAGGVIVIGVQEGPHGAASEATPFSTDVDDTERQITQACYASIRPFLKVDVKSFRDGKTDGWFMTILVPRSRDAPHALVKGNSPSLEFPVRDGASTRWMREAELGPRYRDRYTARGDNRDRLNAIHDRIVDTEFSPDPWLSLACVPIERGSRPAGADARAAEVEFLTSWDGPPASEVVGLHVRRPMTAVGRTVFSDRAPGDRPRHAHIELGHDGSGLCAHRTALVVDPGTSVGADEKGPASWLASDRIEWDLFTGLLLLTDHAIDTNAGGELEVVAQLHRPDGVVGMCTPVRHERGGYFGDDVLHATETTAAYATVPIGEARDYRSIAAGAFALGTDILAEFGIDEPRIFTHDGSAVAANLNPNWTYGVEAWMRQFLGDASDAETGSPDA